MDIRLFLAILSLALLAADTIASAILDVNNSVFECKYILVTSSDIVIIVIIISI